MAAELKRDTTCFQQPASRQIAGHTRRDRTTATPLDTLMHEGFGYPRFLAQGCRSGAGAHLVPETGSFGAVSICARVLVLANSSDYVPASLPVQSRKAPRIGVEAAAGHVQRSRCWRENSTSGQMWPGHRAACRANGYRLRYCRGPHSSFRTCRESSLTCTHLATGLARLRADRLKQRVAQLSGSTSFGIDLYQRIFGATQKTSGRIVCPSASSAGTDQGARLRLFSGWPTRYHDGGCLYAVVSRSLTTPAQFSAQRCRNGPPSGDE
jgi:hypothetical protein